MNSEILANSKFRIKPKKLLSCNFDTHLTGFPLPTPPPGIPELRRTSRGIDCWNCEPSSSYFKLCRLSDKNQQIEILNNLILINLVEVYKPNNYGIVDWYPMRWGLQLDTLDVHYWATSYMTGDYHIINKHKDTFYITRAQFSDIMFYCLLKFKILGRRKIRQRYIRTVLPDTVSSRREHLRSRVGFIMTTSQRGRIRRKIMQFLIGK